MSKFVSRALACASLPVLALFAAPAVAVPIVVTTNLDLTSSGYTFSFGDSSFTFSSTGNIFAPLAVSTGGTGQISSFGGFLNIAVTPSSSFINRGTVQYGPGIFGAYAAFPTTSQVSGLGDAYLGLKATSGGNTYYGYSYTTNARLNLFAFESTPNTIITATPTGTVPEPAAWAMMVIGFGLVGAAMRARRASVRVRFA